MLAAFYTFRTMVYGLWLRQTQRGRGRARTRTCQPLWVVLWWQSWSTALLCLSRSWSTPNTLLFDIFGEQAIHSISHRPGASGRRDARQNSSRYTYPVLWYRRNDRILRICFFRHASISVEQLQRTRNSTFYFFLNILLDRIQIFELALPHLNLDGTFLANTVSRFYSFSTFLLLS